MISEQKEIPSKTKANVFKLNTCLSCTAVINELIKFKKENMQPVYIVLCLHFLSNVIILKIRLIPQIKDRNDPYSKEPVARMLWT